MVNSQNGWPAKPDTSTFTRFDAGGRGWWAANADVAVIFTDLIEWFDHEIEDVEGGVYDDWSYANRLVRGSTRTVSNHGSATAVDINATRHPRGVKNTFSPSQVKLIREKLATYDRVVRWGGTYTTVVDDMHFEINADKAAAKRLADKIRERDMFTKEDKAWISSEIRAQLIEVLSSEKLVANKPLDEGAVQGANWTYNGVLAALDQKTDLQGRSINDILAVLNADPKP